MIFVTVALGLAPFQAEYNAEVSVVERVKSAWMATTLNGLAPAMTPRKVHSELDITKTVGFGGVSISWNKNSGKIYSILAPPPVHVREPDPPNLNEEALRAKANAALGHLVPPWFTFNIVAMHRLDDRRASEFTFDQFVQGVPIRERHSGSLTLDNRSAQILSYHGIDLAREFPIARPQDALGIGTLSAIAEARYLETQPLPYAAVRAYGIRWVSAPVDHGPFRPDLRGVKRLNLSYPVGRAILAYSVWYDWQNVCIDAMTGDLILVFGWDAYILGPKKALPKVEAGEWKVPGGKTYSKLTLAKKIPEFKGRKILLNSKSGYALVGEFDGKSSLRVDKQTFTMGKALARDVRKWRPKVKA